MRYGVEVVVKHEQIRSVFVEASSEEDAKRKATAMAEGPYTKVTSIMRVAEMPEHSGD